MMYDRNICIDCIHLLQYLQQLLTFITNMGVLYNMIFLSTWLPYTYV